jgi:Beta-propeller repeat
MPFAHKVRFRAASLAFFLIALLLAAWNISPTSIGAAPAVHAPIVSPAANAQLLNAYAKLPLSFEVNRGQASPEIQFLSRGHNLALFLGSGDASFMIGHEHPRASATQFNEDAVQRANTFFSPFPSALSIEPSASASQPSSSGASHLLRMSLLGARPGLRGAGVAPLPGKYNYYRGLDPKNWSTHVETYAKVKYTSIYPGIDLLYYGNQQRLEYDFVVAPGSNPKQIELAFDGADHARIDPSSGDLVLDSGDGEVRFQKPSIYQVTGDSSAAGASKHFVEGNYILEAGNRIRFNIAAYDSSKPLIIDPVLSFFTYLGGMLTDFGLHIAADSTGVYVTGFTTSPDFPTSPSALSTIFHSATCGNRRSFPCPDAFVTKFKSDGSAIIYSTYLGGSRSDIGIGIAVDSSQQAYVVGETESMDFPTTGNAFQVTAASRLTRAFLTKLSSTGQLLYSTYLGGIPGSRGVGLDPVNDTFATSVAVDNLGHAYLTGYTRSNSLPTTAGVVQPVAGGNSGPGGVQCHSPVTGVIPCSDGFVAKLNTMASGVASLVYATYLGGSYYDAATGIAIDSNGNAYVVGATLSNNFPVAAAFQPSPVASRCGPFGSAPNTGGHVCASGFVAKLNTTATVLLYSSYLGGTGDTAALGVAVDSLGNAYLTGATNASDFPASAGVPQRSLGGGTCSVGGASAPCPDAFVAKINSAGALSYATFLGGSGLDFGVGVAVDSAGDAFVSGITNSANFPTASPIQAALGGGSCSIRISGTPFPISCPDAFLTELDPAGATLVYSTYLGGTNADFATSVALDGLNNVYVSGGTLSPGLATAGAFQTMLGSKGDAFVFKVAPPPPPPPPSFTLNAAAAGSTSTTVTAGQTATYNLQITPVGGFTGTVSFTCTGAPSKATCNPPSPVSVTGNAAVPFSVTVNSTAASVTPPIVWRIPNIRVPVWPVCFVFLLLFLLATQLLAIKPRLAIPNSRLPLLWTAVLLSITLFIIAGCGSSSNSNNGSVTKTPGTPAGNYTLTLTGTSSNVTQNLSLTLTVN